jgi:hypothetical protein
VRRYWCRSCGIVREGTEVAPWCRHGDIKMPAYSKESQR